MPLRVGCILLLASSCSEAFVASLEIRPSRPVRSSTRPALVGSLDTTASLNSAARDWPSSYSGRARTPWMQRINKVSNVASILCAIDCTVFPVLLTLMPILNLGSSGKYEVMLHAVSHKVALYFVAPVGGAAVGTNFAQHRNPLVLLWGLAGLSLVLLANVHLAFLPHTLDHALHEWHSVINVMGCFTLLSSQWYSHRLLHKMGLDCGHSHGGKECGHDH